MAASLAATSSAVPPDVHGPGSAAGRVGPRHRAGQGVVDLERGGTGAELAEAGAVALGQPVPGEVGDLAGREVEQDGP